MVIVSIMSCQCSQKKTKCDYISNEIKYNETKTGNGKGIDVETKILYYFFPSDSILHRNYSEILNEMKKCYDNKHSLSIDEIEESIPRTKQEFEKYYCYLKNEKQISEHQLFFHYIDSLVYYYATKDSNNCLYLAFNFAQFLSFTGDDEYHQIWWDGLQDLAYKQHEKYCQILKCLKNDSIKHIYEDFY